MTSQFKASIHGVLILVGVMWLVFFADAVLPGDWRSWGITPRTLGGLPGVVFSPFLHASLGHLIGNTLPLIVLTVLLVGSRKRTWETICEITLLSGGLLWLFGRSVTHVGASGLIYGLIAFLIVAGFLEQKFTSLLVALLVGFLYGGSLVSGILPTAGESISWDGHFLGALGGCVIAYFVSRNKPTDDSTVEITSIS